MDKRQIGQIVNSQAFRIAKGVVAAIFVGNANKAIKEGQCLVDYRSWQLPEFLGEPPQQISAPSTSHSDFH